MSGIFETLAQDGFSEMFQDLSAEGGINFETAFYGKGYGHLHKRDKKIIRHRPRHKGLATHTNSEHKSHGYGSFCRTLPSHRTCR